MGQTDMRQTRKIVGPQAGSHPTPGAQAMLECESGEFVDPMIDRTDERAARQPTAAHYACRPGGYQGGSSGMSRSGALGPAAPSPGSPGGAPGLAGLGAMAVGAGTVTGTGMKGCSG